MNEIAITESGQIAQSFSTTVFDSFVSHILISYADTDGKTARTYITNIRQFAAWMRYEGVTQPKEQDIANYRQYLLTPHDAITLTPAGWSFRTDGSGNRITIECKANTAAQYLRTVCMFFHWTAAEGIYPDIAAGIRAPKIRSDRHSKDALTAQDVLKIERSITSATSAREAEQATKAKDTAGRMQRSTEQGKRLYAMYMLAVNCGLRTVELNRAKIKDIVVKDGRAVLYVHGKGHTSADTPKPMATEVYEAVKDYIQARKDRHTKDSYLFVATGNRSGGRPIATTTISTMLKQAMQAAGYDSDRITAHSLRHTAGTNVQEITGDLYATQQYMRHANPATTEIYLHCENDRRQGEIADRLYNHYHGKDEGAGQLPDILATLDARQLAQLTAIAQAMTR